MAKPAIKPAPARAAGPSREVTKPQSTAVAVPDYIKTGTGRGNEAVEMADVVIPRIEVVQALSPCCCRTFRGH